MRPSIRFTFINEKRKRSEILLWLKNRNFNKNAKPP